MALDITAESADRENLARHPAVMSLLQRRIEVALSQVANWERVKKFVVLSQPFSVANDELTVSLKLRRTLDDALQRIAGDQLPGHATP